MRRVDLAAVKWAMSIVWSRSTPVAEQDNAIVPVADFMNMQKPETVSHPMVRLDIKASGVSFLANKDIESGEEILAPHGILRPIPNAELLADYGIVWDANFYDGVPFKAEVAAADPLKEQKTRLRSVWQCHRPVIPLFHARVPDELICFARVLNANAKELKAAIADPDSFNGKLLSTRSEKAAYKWIRKEARRMLHNYPTTVEFDRAVLASEQNANVRNAIAIRLREKEILHSLVDWAQSERSKIDPKKAPVPLKDEL